MRRSLIEVVVSDDHFSTNIARNCLAIGAGHLIALHRV